MALIGHGKTLIYHSTKLPSTPTSHGEWWIPVFSDTFLKLLRCGHRSVYHTLPKFSSHRQCLMTLRSILNNEVIRLSIPTQLLISHNKGRNFPWKLWTSAGPRPVWVMFTSGEGHWEPCNDLHFSKNHIPYFVGEETEGLLESTANALGSLKFGQGEARKNSRGWVERKVVRLRRPSTCPPPQ